MTETEALIRDLGDALLRGWDCRAPDQQGKECRELLEHAADWLRRQRQRKPFTVITGGKR